MVGAGVCRIAGDQAGRQVDDNQAGIIRPVNYARTKPRQKTTIRRTLKTCKGRLQFGDYLWLSR